MAYGSKYLDTDFSPVVFARMGEAKARLGDRATAIDRYRKAMEKSKTTRISMMVMKRMASDVGRDEAIGACEEKLKEDPESLIANYGLFELRSNSGEYHKALAHIGKCLEVVGTDSKAYEKLATDKVNTLVAAYLRTSDNDYLEKAIAEYKSLLEKLPNNISVLNNLAYLLADNNQKLSEALEYAQRAFEDAPDSPDILETYAYVLYKNEQYDKAMEISQRSIQLYEKSNVSGPVEAYEHLGMIKESLEMNAEAIVAYRRAIEIGEGKMSEEQKERLNLAIERVLSKP